MDVALLHNPSAGDETHTDEKLVRLLKQHGHKVKYSPLGEGLQDEKLLKWADVVVAAGGDGAVRKTVERMAGRSCPVAILPLGTANNVARSLGIGTDIAAIVAGWKRAKPRPIDLGIAKGPWGRTRFIEGVGFGLIGRTMSILDGFDERVVHPFASAGDKLHRDMAVLTALAHEFPPVWARLKIGGERVKDDFLLVEILNISRAGPGFILADDAKPDDGELNVVSVLGDERKKLISELEKHTDGRGGARLHDERASRIRLEIGPCELRVDDKICLEPGDFEKFPDRRARVDIKVEPGAVTVLA